MTLPENYSSQWKSPWPPLALLSLVLLSSFLWRVWPTPYAYLPVGTTPYLYRVHRVTGETFCFVIGEGWKSYPQSIPPTSK